MATTIYYDPGKAHTSATTLNSAADHYHTFDVSAVNQWIKGSSGVPSNAKITKVEFQLSTYISSSLANVDLSLYLGSGENNGTNLGSKGDVGTSSKTYTWDLTSYYSGSGHNTYPFTMNTSQPHLVPYWTVNYIFSIKVYCPTVRLAVTYEIPTYTVTWMNYDDTTLETDFNVPNGTTPAYDGATPTRPQDAQYTYDFSGWSPAVGAITASITYKAQFKATLRKYTVRWFNEDGTRLETDTTEYGVIPTYDGATPVKPSTPQNTYIFAGWHIEISEVKGDIDYYATYVTVPNTYTVTWKNEDGTILEVDEKVPYGDIPKYNGTTPTIASTVQYDFVFADWDTEITEVTRDIVYTAVYTKILRKYNIEIISPDESIGTVTGAVSGTYEYGTQFTLTATAKNGYYFAGWVLENFGDSSLNYLDNPITITVLGDETIFVHIFGVNNIRIGTSKPTGIYYNETTKIVTIVIEEEVTIEPTGADTVDGLHFAVSNTIPDGANEIIGWQVGTTYIYKL